MTHNALRAAEKVTRELWASLWDNDELAPQSYIAEALLAFAQQHASSLRERVERLEVQLTGCSTAALGWSSGAPAMQGEYGWSPAYQDVLNLRTKYETLQADVALVEKRARLKGRIEQMERIHQLIADKRSHYAFQNEENILRVELAAMEEGTKKEIRKDDE